MGRMPAGFTLIDSLVALAVAGVLLALAVPSFADGLRRQRVAGTMHLLSADFAMARTMALTRRSPIVICPGTPVAGCRGGNRWTEGWLVFEDADGDRQPRVGDILRVSEPTSTAAAGFRIESTRPYLRYQPSGHSAHSNLSVHLCKDDVLQGSVIVNRLGRVRGERPATPETCPG